jgi:hypothetical protein
VFGAPWPAPRTMYIPRTSLNAGLPPTRRYCSTKVPWALSKATTRPLAWSHA